MTPGHARLARIAADYQANVEPVMLRHGPKSTAATQAANAFADRWPAADIRAALAALDVAYTVQGGGSKADITQALSKLGRR